MSDAPKKQVKADHALTQFAAGRSDEELKGWANHMQGADLAKELEAGVRMGAMAGEVHLVEVRGKRYYFVGKTVNLRARMSGEANWPKKS